MAADVAAVVPAAGMGRRFRSRNRKLYAPLGGAPLLSYTLRALQAAPAIRWIQVVARPDELGAVRRLIARCCITKALPPCRGGSCRSASVANGVRVLPAQARWVLVHDGARPCVTPRLVQAAVRAARTHGAVACGLPALLTVKEVAPGGDVRATLDRRRLWFVQTPQVFSRGRLTEAFAKARGRLERFSDDAAVVEAAGGRVRMVLGDPLNIKVTTREDLILAEAILRYRCPLATSVGDAARFGIR